jgi:TetR/AcrR family transcriptional repressor of nem operon
MRTSRIQARENRDAVIEAASRLFRERGFDGIGLIELMEGAGLTKGAFYKQFESKDDLAALATARAVKTAGERWGRLIAENPGSPLAALASIYLAPGHINNRGEGCPLAALGADAARQTPRTKASFEAGVRSFADLLAENASSSSKAATKNKAYIAMALLIGAVTIARMVNDERLSKDVVSATAKHIRSLDGA